MDEPITSGEGILHQSDGVDLLPANIELSGLEVTLVNTMSRETILREYLKTVQADYDVILLDCSPSLGMLTNNALAAADSIVISVQAQFLSIKGLEQLLRTIAKVRRQITPDLSISGILITMADLRTNYTRDIIELLHSTYDDKLRIFDSIIPMSVRAAEISASKIQMTAYDDLFQSDGGTPEVCGKKVQEIALSDLFPFANHPYSAHFPDFIRKT